MLSEAYIVSRSIVDSVVLVVIIVLGEYFGIGARQHATVVEPELGFDKFVNIGDRLMDSPKDVDSFGLAILRDFSCF